MDIVVGPLDTGDVPGLSVAGEVDMATAPLLRDALVQLAAEHPGARAVIDLDGVTFLDSLGLGVLLGGLRRMHTTGGDLALVCTNRRLLEVLASCRLDRVFDIHRSVAEAAGVSRHG
jgi:anti-sigma B factor antagonist